MPRKQVSWTELGALNGTSCAEFVKQLHAREKGTEGRKASEIFCLTQWILVAVLCRGCIVSVEQQQDKSCFFFSVLLLKCFRFLVVYWEKIAPLGTEPVSDVLHG